MKVNIAEVLRRELARPSWEGESVAIGAATDPYQPAEGRYRLTRGCLQALGRVLEPVPADHARADDRARRRRPRRGGEARQGRDHVLDPDARRGRLAKTEPSTAHPRQRLRALKELVDAGIKVGVGMAPILPGISDRPEQLREVVQAAREAGATGIWTNLLNLRPGTREHFLEHLAQDCPEQLPHYQELYARRGLPAGRRDQAGARASRALARELGVRDRRRVRIWTGRHDERAADV